MSSALSPQQCSEEARTPQSFYCLQRDDVYWVLVGLEGMRVCATLLQILTWQLQFRTVRST